MNDFFRRYLLRPTIAVGVMVLSVYAASAIGLIDLIANGYGLLTYAFIALLIIPVLTLGIWKLRQGGLAEAVLQGNSGKILGKFRPTVPVVAGGRIIRQMLRKQPVSISVLSALTCIPARILAGAAMASAMVACHAPGPTKPAQPVPLELIRTGTLTVPDTCSADGSVIVAFTVYESGQTGDIQATAGPACLQQALTAWVASFRYLPQSARIPASIEWLLVEAKKGS